MMYPLRITPGALDLVVAISECCASIQASVHQYRSFYTPGDEVLIASTPHITSVVDEEDVLPSHSDI